MVGTTIVVARHFKMLGSCSPRGPGVRVRGDEVGGGEDGCKRPSRPAGSRGTTRPSARRRRLRTHGAAGDGGERRLNRIRDCREGHAVDGRRARRRPGTRFVRARRQRGNRGGRGRRETGPPSVPDRVARRRRRIPHRGCRGDGQSSHHLHSPRSARGTVAKLGSIVLASSAPPCATANPTMLKAGYKANVIPATAEAVLDCRVLPGPAGRLQVARGQRQSSAPTSSCELGHQLPSYETTFDGDLVDAMNAACSPITPRPAPCRTCSPPAPTQALRAVGDSVASGSYRCCSAGPDLRRLFHGIDERYPWTHAAVRHRGPRTLTEELLTHHRSKRKTHMAFPYDPYSSSGAAGVRIDLVINR